jgi:glycolate oxidase FAD binding subunit
MVSAPTGTVPFEELGPAQRAALAVDEVEPRWRARPTSQAELADVLRQAAEQDLVVAPRGGGTRLGLGNPPARLDLVVETGGLRRVVEYEPADLTITVEAGLPLGELQALLGEQGQFLALDPVAQPGSTIGGVIATNASGPLRFAFGTARDLVIGTRVANPEGYVTHAGGRVVKNVAGYDLSKLYIGSLGTLGVIVELSFKLAPIPPASGLVVAQFGELRLAEAYLRSVLHSPLGPLAVELLAPGAARAVGWPDELTVALRVGGYANAVDRQVRDLRKLANEQQGQHLDVDDAGWAGLRDLALGVGPDAVVVRAAAPISASAALVELLSRELADYRPLVWAHAGNGVAYAAFDATPHEDADALHTTLADTRRRVVELGSNASLVVERCPVRLKRGFDVWGEVGPSLRLMQALKSQLDPRATLNRGRYVGGI